MKILVIRFSSIGDIVLTTPVVRCIKKQVENAEVHYLTKKAYSDILKSNPYIDKIILLDESWDLMLHELKIEEYDYIIDLHNNLRTLRVKQALKGVKQASFNKLNIGKWILTNFKINILPNNNIVDRYLDTAKALGVKNDGFGLDYFIPPSEILTNKDIPASHSLGYIGIVIGAALATKKLPIHKLKELCAAINFPIMLLGGMEDKDAGEAIAAQDPIRIYNSCGKFSLNESADLVKRALVIISHDTGLMHIAAAFKKPIISIWGNTTPSFGMSPYFGNNQITNEKFEVANLSCRPCSKIGHESCPKKHFKCMELQNISSIASSATRLLGK